VPTEGETNRPLPDRIIGFEHLQAVDISVVLNKTGQPTQKHQNTTKGNKQNLETTRRESGK